MKWKSNKLTLKNKSTAFPAHVIVASLSVMSMNGEAKAGNDIACGSLTLAVTHAQYFNLSVPKMTLTISPLLPLSPCRP